MIPNSIHNNTMLDLVSPGSVEVGYPTGHCKSYTMKEISDDKKQFDETQKDNTYISVHIQPKSSNRSPDAKEPITKSNEKIKDNKIGKENDPQKYFVKCNKSDHQSKKFCKECKNYRTKLKATKLGNLLLLLL